MTPHPDLEAIQARHERAESRGIWNERAAHTDRAALLAEVERLRAVVEWIAHFDDAHMETARTLHYDMRGKARSALAAASLQEESTDAR